MNGKIAFAQLKRATLIALGLLLFTSVQAGVYRWVDQDGVTVYSQVPPPANVATKKIEPPPPPSVTEKEAWQEVNQNWSAMRDRVDVKKEQATADAEQEEKKQKEENNCTVARQTIQHLESSEWQRMRTANGKIKRLTTEEREERLQEAHEMQEKYCE